MPARIANYLFREFRVFLGVGRVELSKRHAAGLRAVVMAGGAILLEELALRFG